MTDPTPPAATAAKPPLPKVAASSTLSGAGAGAVIAWLWNGYVKQPAMTAEIAVAIAMLLGPIIAYAISWLPKPRLPKPPE